MSTDQMQILGDIEAARNKWACEIESVTAMILIEKMLGCYQSGIKFKETLDAVVDSEEDLSEAQHHAYKYVIGREFGRRAARRKALSTKKHKARKRVL